MYGFLIVWEQTHRVLIWGVIAVGLWVATYLIYLRQDISIYLRNRRAQRWGVDMSTRTVTSGRKPIV
jgi:hypothetical protein